MAHAADDYFVVAAGEGCLDGALDDRDHVREARGPGRSAMVADLVPGGRKSALGEVGRQLALSVAEHVDRERAVIRDGCPGCALEVEAGKHQRRLKRERRDRVRGCPDGLTIRSDRGDDRDPGGEVSHRVAQLSRGDLRPARAGNLACGVVNSGHDLQLSMVNGDCVIRHENP